MGGGRAPPPFYKIFSGAKKSGNIFGGNLHPAPYLYIFALPNKSLKIIGAKCAKWVLADDEVIYELFTPADEGATELP